MPEDALQASLHNAEQRSRWARRLLIGTIMLDIVAIFSGYGQLSLLRRAAQGEPVSEAEALANDSRQATVGVIQIALLVVAAIVFLMWLHRAYGTLELVGNGRTKYTPGWAVGYWFIPIMNLFLPYQTMKELWVRTTTRNIVDPGEGEMAPGVIGWWWFTWVASGLIGRLVYIRSRDADTIPEFMAATQLGMAVDLLSVIAGLLAIRVVAIINEQQQAQLSGQPARA